MNVAAISIPVTAYLSELCPILLTFSNVFENISKLKYLIAIFGFSMTMMTDALKRVHSLVLVQWFLRSKN